MRKDADGRSYKRYEFQLCLWGACQYQESGIDIYSDGEVKEWNSTSTGVVSEHNPLFDALQEGHEMFKFAENAKLFSEAVGEAVLEKLSFRGSKLDVIEQTYDELCFRPEVEGTMVLVHLTTGQEISTLPVTANQEYRLALSSISGGGYILIIKPTSETDKAAFRKITIAG